MQGRLDAEGQRLDRWAARLGRPSGAVAAEQLRLARLAQRLEHAQAWRGQQERARLQGLAERLRTHYPKLVVQTGSNDPAGFDVVVNATPLGMKEGDPLPFDVTRIDPAAMVGEVVMKTEYTPLLQAALAKGCGVQVGTDMLFEMIPAYLEFFGYGTATADELRAVAQIKY